MHTAPGNEKDVMRPSRAITLLVILFLVAASARSADQCAAPDTTADNPGGLRNIPRIGDDIDVDGVIDESAWEGALSMELDVETRPGENIEPPVRTEVLIP